MKKTRHLIFVTFSGPENSVTKMRNVTKMSVTKKNGDRMFNYNQIFETWNVVDLDKFDKGELIIIVFSPVEFEFCSCQGFSRLELNHIERTSNPVIGIRR